MVERASRVTMVLLDLMYSVLFLLIFFLFSFFPLSETECYFWIPSCFCGLSILMSAFWCFPLTEVLRLPQAG